MIADHIQAFSLTQLHSAMTLYLHLKANGFTIEDLADYIKGVEGKRIENRAKFIEKVQREVLKKIKEWKAVAPICPKCKGHLNRPKHICKKKGPENIKGYTCLWYCENGNCIYENYTYENAEEEINKLMKGRRKNGSSTI